QLKQIYPNPGERAQDMSFVPARHGDLFLRLSPKGERFGIPDERKAVWGSLSLHLPGQYRAIVTLSDIEGVAHENLAYGGNPANKMHHDKRIHLVPDARLLV